MTASLLLFLSMRVVHVVLAGAWLGAALFVTLYLGPIVKESGAGGPPLVAALVRRGVAKYMASIGGLTIVTGIYLFWRFTSGFDPALSASRAGMTFSIGALTGLIALILGGSMVAGSAKKLAALSAQAAAAGGGAGRAELTAKMEALQDRMFRSARIVVLLLLISMAAMALGHYI